MKSASVCALFLIIAISCVKAMPGGRSQVLDATPEVQAIDPLPCHPGKDQNISGHIVLDQNVCVI